MVVSKFPYPPVKPNATVELKISSGLSRTGAQTIVESTKQGFYNERSAWVQSAEGKKVESKGLVIFFHDIFPEIETLTGSVKIGNTTMSIIVGKRLRNPDGTVHHVELELS